MKCIIALSLLGVFVALPAYAQKASTTEQQVLKATQQLNEASLIKKDRATMERFYGNDYVYNHSNGTVTNKAQEIAEYMSSDLKWTAQTTADLKVRVYHDMAIVTGVTTLTGSAKGYASGARRFTEIWVRRNGRWQTIGGQSTIVPAQ
jgi:ketosteroid isomerase-like protein